MSIHMRQRAVSTHAVPIPVARSPSPLDTTTQTMHSLCTMPSKTISLRIEAYERLRRAKRDGESFSDVVMRARWENVPLTGGELLTIVRERGPLYSADELREIEAMKSEAPDERDKWPTG